MGSGSRGSEWRQKREGNQGPSAKTLQEEHVGSEEQRQLSKNDPPLYRNTKGCVASWKPNEERGVKVKQEEVTNGVSRC